MSTNFFNDQNYYWAGVEKIANVAYRCGYCGLNVASDRGYSINGNNILPPRGISGIRICPNCKSPTAFNVRENQFPSSAFGNNVIRVPEELYSLYEEARRCTAQNCFTAAVLICRKMLMNIAVERGADQDLRFVEYVEYLSEQGFIPPNGKHWVKHIRLKGNDANHEILLMNDADAKNLITFTEMLLKFIYEFPALVPSQETT